MAERAAHYEEVEKLVRAEPAELEARAFEREDDGENGDIKDMYGRGADDVYIDLPIGTVVFL